ncbi:Lipopolysaccharide biosynthesis protein, LPS:glycosyltransferase [Selenomonas ruminantium]|uniref:Lipopolysaccharide biosynthesis protein, LPS:glycosyltransferase n=1 Tax=Selenomonas ruminantium TaxID=971 RepID=A0A1M6TFC3_SELRU|nr:glycosyltransferase family 8 protein [Selenomonas ruminantium]SHK55579.1 Lipopolysaccharide biosynthesis protein, LPS:glycosyltransferase [Selenomonas ruminantium]
MAENQEINIVFASDDNYIQHAVVAMMSIRCNTSEENKLRFFVLADNIASANQEKAQASFADRNAEVYFIPVDDAPFADFFVSGQLSRTAYFRLKMAELLPPEVTKAIYLDCDLLVLGDIAELWTFNMAGQPLAAVPDYGIMASHKDWPRKQQTLSLRPADSYFNSGVLLVDVAAWRRCGYGQAVLDLAHQEDYQHHDQDALNKVFYGKWVELPLRWNVIPPIWNMFLKILRKKSFRQKALAARRHIAILHYAGGYKPWEYREIPSFNAAYYRYFRETAFRDEVMPRMDKRRRGRSISRQLWRLRIADFWQGILGNEEEK